MQDIVTGAVIIVIGFFLGGSVFLGNFDLLNLFFDGLGTFFIIKGLAGIYRAKRTP